MKGEAIGSWSVTEGSAFARTRRDMGINRWSDIEERKRIETKAKAGDEVPKGKKGDASSRLEASNEPAEDEEKRQVIEKLQNLERDS